MQRRVPVRTGSAAGRSLADRTALDDLFPLEGSKAAHAARLST